MPELLFQIGESFVTEKKYRPGDRRLGAARPASSPASEPAAHAQFLTASIYETEKGNPAEAIERFKKITVEPWQSQAHQRIAVMECEVARRRHPAHLPLGRDGRTQDHDPQPRDAAVHRLQAQRRGLFPQEERARERRVARHRPGRARRRLDGPGRRLRPVQAGRERRIELKKLELPGVYVVKVTDEKTLQATTLVIGSDLDAIVKTSRDQILVFAQDMKTGKGRAGARVLVADGGQVVLEATTGADGVLLRDWNPARGRQRPA